MSALSEEEIADLQPEARGERPTRRVPRADAWPSCVLSDRFWGSSGDPLGSKVGNQSLGHPECRMTPAST